MERVKLCVLILSANDEPWRQLLISGPKATWVREVQGDTPIFSYVARPNDCSQLGKLVNLFLSKRIARKFWSRSKVIPKARFLENGEILVDIQERWDLMTLKFLGACELLTQTLDFDFLIRINTTTYLNLNSIKQYINKDLNYAGVPSKNRNFGVGWGLIFSRKAILDLLRIFKEVGVDSRGFEDEVIGKYLTHIGYTFTPLPESAFKIFDSDIDTYVLSKAIFVRLKKIVNGKRTDSLLFEDLYNRMRKL